jgi:hypothetical protein
MLHPPRLFDEEVSVLPPLMEFYAVDDEAELSESRLLLHLTEERDLCIRGPWG